MKRTVVVLLIAGIVVLAGLAVTAGLVYAQRPTQPGTGPGGYGTGYGMMGGGYAGMGVMHTYMEKALAAKLGMTLDAYQQALTNGETFWTLAQEKGISTTDAQQMMLDARNEALAQMVADGVITQSQADLIKQNMGGMIPGACHGTGTTGANGTGYGPGGMMGRGRMWNNTAPATTGGNR